MNNLTKKCLVTALAALSCSLVGVSKSSAQSANFTFDDGVGTPNAGTYVAGTSFTFAVDLNFTSGGSIANLEGLSYWLQQLSPAGAPFNFAITLRDPTGSQFSDLQTPGLSYPQNINPVNANDLGAALANGNTPLGNGTYFVADITVSIASTAAYGNYTLADALTGGTVSVISDSNGHTLPIAEEDYTVTVVPEPATWIGAGLVAALLAWTAIRRRSRQLS